MFSGLSPADSVFTPLRVDIMIVLIALLTLVIFRKDIPRWLGWNKIRVREDPRAVRARRKRRRR